MTKAVVLTLALLLAFGSVASADTWNIDVTHSEIGFSVKHMIITTVHGRFDEFSGTITFDGKNWDAASTEWTVQAGSVNTNNEDRDAHLRQDDFFGAKDYPTLTFKSTKVTAGDGNTFTLVGDLTIRGVTKSVTFDGEFAGVVDDPWGNTRAGFTATTTINRQDFGVSWSEALDTGGLVVSDQVDITVEVQAIKAK